MFDVPMGSYDGSEICELVGSYILSSLSKILGKDNTGLYRDDGLAVTNSTPRQCDKMKKEIISTFHALNLRITIEVNIKITNFLDITLNLTKGSYQPFSKTNNKLLYVDKRSNHPPTILKQIPVSVNKRISNISDCDATFQKAAPEYEKALKESGYQYQMKYEPSPPNNETRRTRNRQVIWYNPPFCKSVKTNIGRKFLNLVKIHFPKGNQLHKLFNKNNVKVSYSCSRNMGSIIKAHNNQLLRTKPEEPKKLCNCRKKDECPLSGKCLTPSVVYKATVTTSDDTKHYIGLTDSIFKTRFSNHKHSFKTPKHRNSTELSKFIWKLKDSNTNYNINWSVIDRAQPYSPKTKRCNLCITEKMHIIYSDSQSTLNKRTEFLSKCRHCSKYLLINN